LVINPNGRATAYELLNELRFLKNEVEKNSGVSLQGSSKKKKEGNSTLKEGRPSFDNSS
jgi:hypothetical protein